MAGALGLGLWLGGRGWGARGGAMGSLVAVLATAVALDAGAAVGAAAECQWAFGGWGLGRQGL